MRIKEINAEIDSLIENKKFPEALLTIDKSLQRTTNRVHQATLLYARGKVLYFTGNVDEAMNEFNRALTLIEGYNTPEAGELLFHIAAFYQLYGKLEMALRMYEQVIKIMPDNSEIHVGAMHNIGAIKKNTGNIDEAIKYFEEIYNKAIKSKDRKGAAYVSENVAESYALNRNKDKTLLWLHRAHKNAVMVKEERIIPTVKLAIAILEGDSIENITKTGDELCKKDIIHTHDVADVYYHYSTFRDRDERKLLLEKALVFYGESGDGIMRSKVEEALSNFADEDYL